MVSESQYVLAFVRNQGCSERKPSAEALGSRDYIRNNAEVHVAVEPSGPSVSGLYLVDYHDDIVLLSDFTDEPDVFGIKRNHASFSLDAFDHHGCGIVLFYRILKGIGLVGGYADEARCQGLEELMVVVLSGGGKSGESAAVEAVFKCYDRAA